MSPARLLRYRLLHGAKQMNQIDPAHADARRAAGLLKKLGADVVAACFVIDLP